MISPIIVDFRHVSLHFYAMPCRRRRRHDFRLRLPLRHDIFLLLIDFQFPSRLFSLIRHFLRLTTPPFRRFRRHAAYVLPAFMPAFLMMSLLLLFYFRYVSLSPFFSHFRVFLLFDTAPARHGFRR